VRRRIAIPAIVAALAALAGGWIFTTRPLRPNAEYRSVVGGDYEVAVRFEHGTAEAAAEKTAAEYRRDGWEELPVSTPTFRLFARDGRMAAFLAEDLPDMARITELRRR
jgi:hypothetical protein